MAHNTRLKLQNETTDANFDSGYGCYYVKDNIPYFIDGSGTAVDLSASGSTVLTTKGDIQGFSTVDARIPIGSNGQRWIADSTQAVGGKYYDPNSDTDQPDLVTDPTTTSSSFSHIISDLEITVTAQTEQILVGYNGTWFHSSASATANYFNFYVDIDSGGYNALATQNGFGWVTGTGTNIAIPVSATFLHTGLTIGSVYTYRPYWATSVATLTCALGGTASGEVHPQFWAIEVG